MKTTLLLCTLILGMFSLRAGITTYPWPTDSELFSDQNYEIRVRPFNESDSTFGNWVDLNEFYSYQRSYPEHWKCGGDAGTDFMSDRSLTFVSFEFTGTIEVEVTQKLSSTLAKRVEVSPKAFGFTPNYFDGKTVRFAMNSQKYISVNFDFGTNAINRDDNRASGYDIKHGVMIFTEVPEAVKPFGYVIPEPGDPGVVVWDNSTPLSEILAADIIYFPTGETEMRTHPDRWERNSSWDLAEADQNWVRTESEYNNAKLYRGKLNLGKDGQKIYLAPGAIVYGGFHSHGHDNNWIYGTGIVTGRKHLMHEIIKPVAAGNCNDAFIDYTEKYCQTTQTKEAFCHTGQGAVYDGVMFLEAWHHTCPSGKNSTYRRTKLIGWCSNNDGIRPGGGSLADKIFIKTSDDYDYARDDHTVKNAVFWPMVNGGLGQLGWNDLGIGYAKYENMYVINTEWHLDNPSKGNIGVLSGGPTNEGIQLQQNKLENIYIENRTNYLVLVDLDNSSGSPNGYLKDFTLKNITTEYPLSNPAGNIVKQKLTGRENTWIDGWDFTNVFIDGVLLTYENYKNYIDINLTGSNGTNTDDVNRVRNLSFNSEGQIFDIAYTQTAGGTIRPQGLNDTIQVAGGMNQTISIIPNTGYRLKSLMIDDALIYEYENDNYATRVQAYVFKEVSANHKVDAVFEAGLDTFNVVPVLLNEPEEIDMTPPTVPGTLVIDSTGSDYIALSWDESTDNASGVKYQLMKDGTAINDIVDTFYLVKNLFCEDTIDFKVRAYDESGYYSEFSNTVTVWTGECSALTIPGRIEAEFYTNMFGIQIEETSDIGGGLNVGFINGGDWLEYDVEVEQDGIYDFKFRIAGKNSGTIGILMDNISVGSVIVPSTGNWQNWQTINLDYVELNAGAQKMRLNLTGISGFMFNINWIEAEAHIVGADNVIADLLEVYPNPFNESFTVKTSINNVSLFDIYGKQLLVNIEAVTGGYEVNTSGLPQGVYILKSGTAVIRLVKE